MPTRARRVRDQREALRAALECPDLAVVRADFREHLTVWIRLHVLHMSWGGEGRPPRGTTQPTRARVCELAGISVSTYKACRRWWEARGYIAIVRPGWSPILRAAALAGPEDRNERQVYVLCIPRRKRLTQPTGSGHAITRPPTSSRREPVKYPPRARKAQPKPGTSPQTSKRPHSGPLRKVSDGWWANLTGPFTAAGWKPAELTRAIDYLPDGHQHRQNLRNVRHPVGWLRWRLSCWLGADGRPLLSPSQRRTAAAERHRAYLAERERLDPLAGRAAELRAARAVVELEAETDVQVPVAELLAQLRVRLGKPLGGHWRDPRVLAAEQAADARAARGG